MIITRRIVFCDLCGKAIPDGRMPYRLTTDGLEDGHICDECYEDLCIRTDKARDIIFKKLDGTTFNEEVRDEQ